MKKHIWIIILLVMLVVVARILGADFTEIFCIGFVAMIYGVVIAGRISKNTDNKVIKVLSGLYRFAVAVFVISFIIIEGIIWYDIIGSDLSHKVPDSKYIIVLGAGLEGDKPGNILTERLDVAIDYLNTHKDTKVICSGGQGVSEIVPESVAMKNYLLEHGISESRILQDNRSMSTIENLENSKAILDSRGDSHVKVSVITSSFNILRAKIIDDQIGLDANYIGANSKFRFNVNYSIREYGAILYNYIELKV
ncbi:MAG: YdcF family protein [Sarcina sp.]